MKECSVRSPFDQKVLAMLPYDQEADVEKRVDAAYRLSRKPQSWPKDKRLAFLQTVASALSKDSEEYAKLIALEGGKPLQDARVEAMRAIQSIQATIAALYEWHGTEIPMGLSAATSERWAMTKREPRGLVLAISAFNHPLNLIVHQVIPALAVGCPVLIKPSSKTPLTCQRFHQLLVDCGLPAFWCQRLLTEDALTEKLAADPRVAVVSFIGSAAVGWTLQRQLARGSIAILEHGGTAPLVVTEDADLEAAIPLIVKGGTYHAGQVCVSVQNVFVQRQRLDACREQLIAALQKLRTGDPMDPQTDVGPMIQPEAADRVAQWIDQAVTAGGRLLCGGERLSPGCLRPALVEGAPSSSSFYKDELFGPGLGLYAYDHLDECVDRINQSRFAFQAAIFTQNMAKALQFVQQVDASTVLINDHTAFRADWMPFGGRKESGLGVGGILPSMMELSREKLVIIKSPYNI
ncbi:MAG TPA: aldehyde dehydrogenase family protein [Oligoflexus sp.]|uniref:aldehyde dehydrogenase family protein n=1 Tax=Oligoflexus sp. TaxID=1971216 RepID=UPI002D5D3720|nr:aldehyde dehydrogenase family protein [Oligoflexus sp.]HYX33756.1 aldehyde dehydrogenase family protein [Oligoflexus sp.]